MPKPISSMQFGVGIGESVSVDSKTSPTKSGFCRVTGTVVEILPSGRFVLSSSDPYFGYNTFEKLDIINEATEEI